MQLDSHSNTVTINSDKVKNKTAMSSFTKLSFFAVGIFVCYFYYGIVLEKITRTDYGENKERFKYSFVLVFVQCVVNTIFAKIMLHTLLKQGVDHTRHMYYASAAFSYLGAMVSSNMALQHVNFPTQVVGKSCKPIPVMLLGVLIGRKRYSLAKYCFVMLIVLGVGLFMYKDKPSTASSDGLGMGELLLLISLALDGFTGAIQERMKSDHKTKSVHMMYNMNLWSSLFLVVCILLKGEMGPFLQFVQTYPFVISNIVLLSGASALGQLFIFLTVTEFGPLPCSLVTTLRKFFTILFSVIFFGNSLVARQWLGATLVFTGPILEVVTNNPSFFVLIYSTLVSTFVQPTKAKKKDQGLALDSFYGKSAPPAKTS